MVVNTELWLGGEGTKGRLKGEDTPVTGSGLGVGPGTARKEGVCSALFMIKPQE